jgi:alpha-beta hydrolase superfamily lysophospholipase
MVHHEEGFLDVDGARLWTEDDVPTGARAHVLILHGYADHLGRYRDFRDALIAEGFGVHAYDQRGHGRTPGPRGHVRRFTDYLDDFDRCLARMRSQAGNARAFVVGHSHGGLEALAALQRRGTPLVDGLVLSAPYLALAFEPPAWKVALARVLQGILPALRLPLDLDLSLLSRDDGWVRSTAADPLYNRVGTPRWLVECTRMQADVLRRGAGIQCPVLLLLGGDDRIASVATSRRFFDTLGTTDRTLREYPMMRHEILNELGKEEVYRDICRWISEHL